LAVLLLVGCANVRYVTTDGTRTTEVTYTRFWTTADAIEGKVGDAQVKANGQKIDISTLQSILNLMGATAK
jgi:hypothetical protein